MSVIINSVDIGSPAHKAGIKDGYTLISINKNEIMDVLDYRFYQNNAKLIVEYIDNKGKIKKSRIKRDFFVALIQF